MQLFNVGAMGAIITGFLLAYVGWLAGGSFSSDGMIVSPAVLICFGIVLIAGGFLWWVFAPDPKVGACSGGGSGSGYGSWAWDMDNPAYWIWMQTYCPPFTQADMERMLDEHGKYLHPDKK